MKRDSFITVLKKYSYLAQENLYLNYISTHAVQTNGPLQLKRIIYILKIHIKKTRNPSCFDFTAIKL
jgi:hypothetical protein